MHLIWQNINTHIIVAHIQNRVRNLNSIPMKSTEAPLNRVGMELELSGV